MGTQQVSAPPRAPSPAPGDLAQPSGVVHINVRHAAAFTVVGNHLSQHRALSLLAIGLAVHIQSLPAGARIGIKHLATRFPESEVRIAAALRELEATGYLNRSRVRLTDGRIVTRTVSYNRPVADAHGAASARRLPAGVGRRFEPAAEAAPVEAAQVEAAPATPAEAAPVPVTAVPAPGTTARDAGPVVPLPLLPVQPVTGRAEVPPSVPVAVSAAPVVAVPAPTSRPAPPRPLPEPSTSDPGLRLAASALLADLRRLSPQLSLSERDIATLAPGVATWLERDAHPDTIRRVLTTDLPVPLKHPAKLLRHRITALLPPPLPGAEALVLVRPDVIVIPLQNCDRCDRAFRSRHPGHCRDCRTEGTSLPDGAAPAHLRYG
ncbi:helix-turn-helix domain-containing protein [Streptomyces sp. NPDC049970]|uniref:helix-turn-helix domain-containing protein n=1 Tax=Streptomyces sp. NPDC049970 TaxID=3155033 RepID=UPI0034297C31